MTIACLDDIGELFAAAISSTRPVETCLAWSQRLRLGDTPDAQVDGVRRPLAFVPDPVQRAILSALADERYQRLAIAGPVQGGKTLAAVNVPIAWCLAELRQPCLIAGPRVDEAAMAWRDKTKPLLVDSGMEWVLPQEGSGSKTGIPDSILASTGARLYLRSGGGANEAGQSAVTVRLAVITEVDSIALSARKSRRAGEGDPGRRKIDLFAGRIAAYGKAGRLVLESTVKLDSNSLILDLVAEGTAGRAWHRCPHCGSWSPREPERLRHDDGSVEAAAATASIVCPINGCLITAADHADAAARALIVHRGQSIQADQVTGDMPSSTTWSVRYTSMDVPRRDLGWLAQQRWMAQRAIDARADHEPMRQYVRDHETRAYQAADHDDRRVRVAATAVASRSALSDYQRGCCPWPGVITLGVDWQEREAWWLAMVSSGDRAAVIDYGVEYLCGRHEQPTPDQRRAVADRIEARAAQGWTMPDASIAPTAGRICDLGGGGWGDQLEHWMRTGRWAWWGARGEHRRGLTAGPTGQSVHRLVGWYDRHDRSDGRRLLMCPNDIKRRILVGLNATASSPVAVLVPQGVASGDHLAKQLTAEKCEPGPDGRLIWSAAYVHNHLLDCQTYAWALGRYLADHHHHTAGSSAAASLSWVRSR